MTLSETFVYCAEDNSTEVKLGPFCNASLYRKMVQHLNVCLSLLCLLKIWGIYLTF